MTLPGNPYALIKDGVCAVVIAMQDYDDATILEKLSEYEYDEVINCSEIGYWIYCGQRYYDDPGVWAYPPVFSTWILDKNTRWWVAPVPFPKDGKEYYWSEEKQSWIQCSSCLEEADSHFQLSFSNAGVIEENKELDLITYGRVKENS